MTLEQRLERLEKMVSRMLPQNEQWVGPTVITRLTGWDKEGMRNARRNGSVKYRRSGNGYKYLLQSLPQQFIREQELAA